MAPHLVAVLAALTAAVPAEDGPERGSAPAVSAAPAELPASRRAATVLFRPLGLIPLESDGTRAWHVDIAAERRVADAMSILVEGGVSPQERAGVSVTLFDARLQARWYVLGDFEGGWNLAAEVDGVTHGPATGLSAASGLALSALVGWKRAFAPGFTLDWQFAAGDVVAQSFPGAFRRSVIGARLGLGWTF